MECSALRSQLVEAGIELRVTGDQLAFRSRTGAVPAALRAAIQHHKAELIVALAGDQSSTNWHPATCVVDDCDAPALASAASCAGHHSYLTSYAKDIAAWWPADLARARKLIASEDMPPFDVAAFALAGDYLKEQIIAAVTTEPREFDRTAYNRLVTRWKAHARAESSGARVDHDDMP